MRVGFLHVGPDDRLARLMVASAKQLGYELVQMTDQRTPAIDGCGVRRLDWDGRHLMTYRMRHLAQLDEPMMICDTDIIHLKDCSDVWERDFDVALTKRGKTLDLNGFDVATVMPYNIGVMFARNPEVWRWGYEYCQDLAPQEQDWYGDQLTMAAAAKEFRCLELPADEWNYTPGAPDECPDVRVLHYKGVRKKWMLHIWPALLNVEFAVE